MANKVVVLDTNVLLHDPQAPTRFGDRNVVLPMQVIEEIDRFKRDPSEKGRNARLIARFLDAHRVKGSLSKGVPLEGADGGTLSVVFCRAETLQQLPVELRGGGGDNNILAVALEQMRQGGLQEEPDVLMVSKDINREWCRRR